MSRQALSKSQTAKDSGLLRSGDLFKRPGIHRMDPQTASVKQRDASDLANVNSQFSHDFSRIPVRSNTRSLPIQAKLKIGQPNDKYEQEADRVADRVMRMPAPGLSASVGEGANLSGGSIQRACTSCLEDEEIIQTKESTGLTPEVTPAISAGIQSLQGGGQPMSKADRGFFEPRFGADFSGVRVHNDARAAGLARSVNARAFTVGRDVVFAGGEYGSGSGEGRRLFAHELVHVVQQRNRDLNHIQRRTLGLAGSCWFENCQNQLHNFFIIPEDGPPGFHPSGSGSSFRVDDMDGLWFKFHAPKNEWFKIPDIGTGRVRCEEDNEEAPSISSPILPFATASWGSDNIHTENPY